MKNLKLALFGSFQFNFQKIESKDREMGDLLSKKTATEHLLDARGPSKHSVCVNSEFSPQTQGTKEATFPDAGIQAG